ncbi:hypothetical protein AK812_SmicGene10851 [Symbiodinium microadriaticum]|uniref:Uncharacterized protein n=1 Tax=Symbiodinium microadriaticum TaxID=2951 RepID=A0A1Q9EEU7_SYMMI|nr:hypothetical protein AK812_SmicGene10851 [Symbiodinium microadriaticum]
MKEVLIWTDAASPSLGKLSFVDFRPPCTTSQPRSCEAQRGFELAAYPIAATQRDYAICHTRTIVVHARSSARSLVV